MNDTSEDIDKKIASIIRKELKNENYDDSCWLKAFKKAEGDEKKAKVIYIDLRTVDLKKKKEKEKKINDLNPNGNVSCGRSFCVKKYTVLSIPKKLIGVQKCEGCGNTLDQEVSEKQASEKNDNPIEPWSASSSQNNIKPKKSNAMNFGDAISSCFSKYATFEGRASRSEYWYFVLFYAGIGGVSSVYVPVISNVFLLATLIPAASAGCRRMHDVGRSGWFQIIPLINLVWLCEESDKSSSNKF
jgi:hypothetical protein|tara:strand:+ start:40 stop:771 length:732 start_codon:yes stop_codon:yes gene_type:complete